MSNIKSLVPIVRDMVIRNREKRDFRKQLNIRRDNIMRKKGYNVGNSRYFSGRDYEFLHGSSGFEGDYPGNRKLTDPYGQHAWLNIAIGIRMRNVARARWMQMKNGLEITEGPVYELFRYVNEKLDAYSLWETSMMWWDLEGEIFWWWGPDYVAGIPEEIHVLNPRKVYMEPVDKRFFYLTDKGEKVPLPSYQILHLMQPNPWDENRGVFPAIAAYAEIEQDFLANRGNSEILKNNAIPQGLLKTDQRLTGPQADELQERWEQNYGVSAYAKKIAVLGSGTSFDVINPDLIKYLGLKTENRTTILTIYGIPLKVANAVTEKTALSGKDSDEQYKNLWSQTLIPQLIDFETKMETHFYDRFGLRELGYSGKFDLTKIPELQINVVEQDARLRKNIQSGLQLIDEARAERNMDTLPWGSTWWKNKNLVDVTKVKEE